jgi:hypothetical protein
VAKQTSLAPALDDPQPALRWQVIYTDRFDREMPPSVEVEGQGLVVGLAELWARFLLETVQLASAHRDGKLEEQPSRGFSEFQLAAAGLRVDLDGSLLGAHRLKRWMFAQATTTSGIVEGANANLLRLLADTHARAGAVDTAALAILDAAEAAVDEPDFALRLGQLRERWNAGR